MQTYHRGGKTLCIYICSLFFRGWLGLDFFTGEKGASTSAGEASTSAGEAPTTDENHISLFTGVLPNHM